LPQARSTVGGRRRNPRAHQGTDLKIGPAAKNSSPGCGDHGSGSQDPTGYEVGRGCTLSDKSEFTETNTVIDFRALIRGFRTPALAGALGLGAGPASESLVRRKPRVGRGAVWLGGSYGRTDRPCGGGGAVSVFDQMTDDEQKMLLAALETLRDA
jgi:hypothetical protein